MTTIERGKRVDIKSRLHVAQPHAAKVPIPDLSEEYPLSPRVKELWGKLKPEMYGYTSDFGEVVVKRALGTLSGVSQEQFRTTIEKEDTVGLVPVFDNLQAFTQDMHRDAYV